jgi:hypothetical protein
MAKRYGPEDEWQMGKTTKFKKDTGSLKEIEQKIAQFKPNLENQKPSLMDKIFFYFRS